MISLEHYDVILFIQFRVQGSTNNTKCYDGLGCIEFTEEWSVIFNLDEITFFDEQKSSINKTKYFRL